MQFRLANIPNKPSVKFITNKLFVVLSGNMQQYQQIHVSWGQKATPFEIIKEMKKQKELQIPEITKLIHL
jgi:hypothetical protein